MFGDGWKETAIVIPAYNEAATLDLLCPLLKAKTPYVIVVDDGSTDGKTSATAKRHGLFVIRNERRLGKGASLRKGFEWAFDQPVRWIATFDADGQHAISDLQSLIGVAKQSQVDVVVGERKLCREKTPFVRRVTNSVMSHLLNLLSGLKIKDSQCGLRVFSKTALRRMDLRSRYFEIESEVILMASRLGLRVASHPVKTIYFDQRLSRIAPLRDTLRWFLLLGSFLTTR